MRNPVRFWPWFFHGSGDQAGVLGLFNRMAPMHLVVGALGAWADFDLKKASLAVILPVVGLFIGVTFAWVGNSHSLLMLKQTRKIAERTAGQIEEYAHIFQLTILLLIVTVVLWGVAGLGVLDGITSPFWAYAVRFLLFGIASVAIYECWALTRFAEDLLLNAIFVEEDDEMNALQEAQAQALKEAQVQVLKEAQAQALKEARAQALEEAAHDLPRELTVHKEGQGEALETVRQWLLQRAQDMRVGGRDVD